MAVDTQQLQVDLALHGDIIYCDEHNESYYLVVMENVADHNTVHDLIDSYVNSEYPNQTNCTLVDGILKCEKSKQ